MQIHLILLRMGTQLAEAHRGRASLQKAPKPRWPSFTETAPRRAQKFSDKSLIMLLLHESMPIHSYCDDAEGNASMADVGDRCLGSRSFAGQDEVMADAVFESVKNRRPMGRLGGGNAWVWCLSLRVTQTPSCPSYSANCASYSANCASSCSAHLTPLMLVRRIWKAQFARVIAWSQVREGLITQGQQHQAAGSSSNGQTGGISFKRQATLLPGQLQIDDMKKTRELAKEHLAMILYKISLPLKLIEDPDLKKCFFLLGVELPTRWVWGLQMFF